MDWVKLLRVAEPVDFMQAFVNANSELERPSLDKKLRRLKERAKETVDAERLQSCTLDTVLDRQASDAELWRVSVCCNYSKLKPEDVVERVRQDYETTAARLAALHTLKSFATRFYPEIPKEWVAALRLTKEEHFAKSQAYQQKLIERADAPVQVSALKVWKKLARWIHSDDPARLACALVMCTGRRTIEVGVKGKFKPSTHSHSVQAKFWLSFAGQGKKRTKARAKQTWFDIPCFAEPQLVCAAVKKLREQIDTQPKRTKLWSVLVPKLLRKTFPLGITSHTFRAVYAVLSHTVFRPLVAINRWTQLILGHSSMKISQAYLNVYVYDLEKIGEVGGKEAGLIM